MAGPFALEADDSDAEGPVKGHLLTVFRNLYPFLWPFFSGRCHT